MIELDLVIKLLWFIIPAIIGVAYAYSWKWVELNTEKTWFQYMFGDKKALLKVCLVFIASCAGVISLDYLSLLDNVHLGIAGVSFGMLIPQKVESKNTIQKPEIITKSIVKPGVK